ncbi:MAG: DUF6010 family protein [Steroidobacteraceae bacterium]
MTAHVIPTVHVINIIAPAAAALAFVFLMSRLREPVRWKVNAIVVAGFSTAYLGGGLGPWELLYLIPGTYVAYRAMESYRYVAIGWLMHSAWDLVHHFYGNPIWPWVPTSAIGCAVFDTIVAAWVFTIARKQDGRQMLEVLAAQLDYETRCLPPDQP